MFLHFYLLGGGILADLVESEIRTRWLLWQRVSECSEGSEGHFWGFWSF